MSWVYVGGGMGLSLGTDVGKGLLYVGETTG